MTTPTPEPQPVAYVAAHDAALKVYEIATAAPARRLAVEVHQAMLRYTAITKGPLAVFTQTVNKLRAEYKIPGRPVQGP